MKKKLLVLLTALPLVLSGCLKNNGLCFCKEPVDTNLDGYCDNCHLPIENANAHTHIDTTGNGKCDICGYNMELPPDAPKQPCKDGEHVDKDGDSRCDICGADLSKPTHQHIDANHDNHCDICNAIMESCDGNHIDQNHDGYCDVCGEKIPVIQGDVTVYLVLSSVGLYKGSKGQTYSDLSLENTIKFTAPVGTALPGKGEVTHMYGSAEFDCWYAYEGLGAPTVYDTVPGFANLILYANFVANGSTPVKPDPDDPTPVEKETYTLLTQFGEFNWSTADAKIVMYCWSSGGNTGIYPMGKVDDSTFTVDIAKGVYTNCLFARMDPVSGYIGSGDWVVWNQTQNMDLSGYHTAQMTSWTLASWVA